MSFSQIKIFDLLLLNTNIFHQDNREKLNINREKTSLSRSFFLLDVQPQLKKNNLQVSSCINIGEKEVLTNFLISCVKEENNFIKLIMKSYITEPAGVCVSTTQQALWRPGIQCHF